jgi:hypothetical protein
MSAARQLAQHRERVLDFLFETARLFGAADEPVILRGTMQPGGSENENR